MWEWEWRRGEWKSKEGVEGRSGRKEWEREWEWEWEWELWRKEYV
jgi:hypothetical protein